ncbi:MAG: hypothetical protein ACU0BS_06585 [Hasllibacter sp.]
MAFLDEMDAGTVVSVTGHGALIAFALFGGLLSDRDDTPPPAAIEAVLVSADSLTAGTASVAPSPAPEPAPPVPAPQPQPAPPPPPAPAPEPAPPEAAAPAPAPEAEPQPALPAAPAPEPETAPEPQATQLTEAAPALAPAAAPRPAPRVAPQPAPAPEPQTEIAPEIVEATVPEPEPEPIPEPEPETETATAPEEAGTVLETEATDAPEEQAALAPASSPVPPTRPSRPAPAPEPEVEVAAAESANAEAAQPDFSGGVSDALADALGGSAEPEAPDLPIGPPMTFGERDGFRFAVSQCWVTDPGAEWMQSTVEVAFTLNQDGTLAAGPSLVAARGGTQQGQQIAYERARSAVARCGARGFDLPAEKYGQWREVVLTFDPTGITW